jgi:hypothetical protein
MIARLKAEIRARLKPVCLHMDDQMFEDLVEKVAMNERRAIQRAGEKFGPSGLTGSGSTTIR